MNIFENLKMAFSSIAANKMRSLLTMLGIIIGISAIITITALGTTLRATIKGAMASLGSNLMYVYIGERDVDNYYDSLDVEMTEEDLLTMEKIEQFLDTYPGEFQIADETPIGNATLKNSKSKNVAVNLVGGYDGTLTYNSYKLIAGRNMTMDDVRLKKHACLVSDIFVEQYFKDKEEPVGETIEITLASGIVQEFNIVGVYKYNSLSNGMGGDRRNMSTPVYIPNTVAKAITGIHGTEYFQFMMFTYNIKYDGEEAKADMEKYFENLYASNKNWAPEVSSMEDQLKTIDMVINVVTVIVSVIAAISLIVGGVGVMNIMLVSVTERTREIGIRKALGAKKRTIKQQFVIEAIIICLIGGIIGILVGILNGELAGVIANSVISSNPDYADILGDIQIVPSVGAIIISLVFSTLTGVFFGLYPAGKAAKMNPIDALRYD